MNIGKEQQSEAKKKVQALLRDAEEARRKKRIDHGITQLIQGKLALLHNDELHSALPDYLAGSAGELSTDNVQQLIGRINEAAESNDTDLCSRAAALLSFASMPHDARSNKKQRQAEAQKKIQDLLENAEAGRKKQRISQGIGELVQGNLELLHNEELTGLLPGYLAGTSEDVPAGTIQSLMERVAEAVASDDDFLRARAVMILSLSADKVLAADNMPLVQQFYKVLTTWLFAETDFVAGYEVICRQLQDISTLLLKLGYWQDADKLLAAMHDIVSGKVKKKNSMQSVVRRSVENVASVKTLDILFENLVSEYGESVEHIENILISLGKPSVYHALQLLEVVEETDSLQIVSNYLVRAGRVSARVFEDKMKDEASWDIVCDMLRILCDMKDDYVYPLIQQNLHHPDLRVQRETLDCILRMEGDSMVSRLVEAMSYLDDSLKNVVVKRLAKIQNDNVCVALLALLDDKIAHNDFSDELLLSSVIVALRPYPETQTLIQLRELQKYIVEQGGARKLQHLLDDTLLILESELRHRRHRKKEVENIEYSDDPVVTRLAKKKAMETERLVISLLEDGQPELAAEKLFERCVEAARDKDFATAERLRDRILSVHPESMSLLFQAEDIIVRERDSQIPSSHVELWGELRRAVGMKEFEQMYIASELEHFQADEIIAREGERDDRLYFISEGTVSLVCTTGGSKTFLKRLQAGSIVGADQFFSISVWTVTARARTPVELYSLKRTALKKIEELHPGIEKNLQEYCIGSNSVPELLRMSGGDRRSCPRYSVEAIIRTSIKDSYGEAGQRTFVGQLQDISQGGFCYTIGIANSESARQLLGRQVQFDLELLGETHFQIEGVIVGIDPSTAKRELFMVHVRLLEFLSPAEVTQIVEMLSSS